MGFMSPAGCGHFFLVVASSGTLGFAIVPPPPPLSPPTPSRGVFFARKSFHEWVSREKKRYIPCPETPGQVVPSKKSRLKFWTNQNAYAGGHQSVDGQSQDCAFSVLPSAHGMGEAGRRVPFQGFHLPRAEPHCQSLGLHDGLADGIRQRDQTIPNGWRVYMSRHL